MGVEARQEPRAAAPAVLESAAPPAADRANDKSCDLEIPAAKDLLEYFDPLAGYAQSQDASEAPHSTDRKRERQRPDASSTSSSSPFGVKPTDPRRQAMRRSASHRADSPETASSATPAMRRTGSSEGARAAGVPGARIPRRESWHAGPRTASPSAEDDGDLSPVAARAGGASLRRRSTSAQYSQTPKVSAMQPPKLPELRESDEDFRAHVEMERTSSWHNLPLVLVAIPSLGAILHGRAENWSDAIVLALVVFYLYHLIKVPWELYYASYARTILPSALSAAGAAEAEAQDDPTLRAIRLTSAAQLKRAELFSLSLTFLVPAIGAGLLHYARGLLSDPDRYINRFLIGLFAIASSIKPVSHAVRLLKQSALYHQEVVHYPSSEVALLKKRLAQLETTASLRSGSEPQSPAAGPAETAPSVSPEQLDSLSRSFRRHSLASASFQTATSARLDDLASTISQLVEVVEAQEGEIVRLQEEQHRELDAIERATAGLQSSSRSPVLHRHGRNPLLAGGLVKGVVRHLLLYLAYPPRPRRSDRHRRSLIRRLVSAAAYVPVTAPTQALGWAVAKSAQGAVHLLGWEDGDDEDELSEAEGGEGVWEDSDEEGKKERNRRRQGKKRSGQASGRPRGLPAPEPAVVPLKAQQHARVGSFTLPGPSPYHSSATGGSPERERRRAAPSGGGGDGAWPTVREANTRSDPTGAMASRASVTPAAPAASSLAAPTRPRGVVPLAAAGVLPGNGTGRRAAGAGATVAAGSRLVTAH